MAPIQTSDSVGPHDLCLVLTFESFAALSRAPPASYVGAIQAAAQRSSNLFILVRFSQPNCSPWSSSAAEGASSSSSATAVPTQSPVAAWRALETFLGRAYGAATRVFLDDDDRVLAKVDVVLEEMRGLNVCLPNGVDVERVEIQVPEEDAENVHTVDAASAATEADSPPGSYEVSALGGTFDHLHAGHKILLTMAASITTRKLIVGVTDEALLVSKKHAEYLESLEARLSATRAFLELIRPTIDHDVVPIQDPYGPTAYEEDLQAIVVSEETRAGGEAVNKKRQESSLGTLDVKVIELMADDAETGATVSAATKMGSTGIRGWLAARSRQA